MVDNIVVIMGLAELRVVKLPMFVPGINPSLGWSTTCI